MSQEIDIDPAFALDNADWPILLVEKSGKILRANPAAMRLLAASSDADLGSLGNIWASENKDSVEKFLFQPPADEPQPLKFNFRNRTTVNFLAQSCAGTQERTFVLQLFKENRPAMPPTPPLPLGLVKQDSAGSGFVLEEAPWPVLVVDKSGRILRSNRSAVRAFGQQLEKSDALLAAVWSPDNKESAPHYLHEAPLPDPSIVRFRLKNGMPQAYLTQCSGTAKTDELLLQLFNVPVAAGATSAMNPNPTPAPSANAVDASLAHKQKLDCALQLARSVSLDFNNALTSILGHTSLLLSRMDPKNPSRGSLMEIEKSAAKAAEIANDLAAFSRQERDSHVQTAGNINSILERAVDVFRTPDQKPITWALQFERRIYSAHFDEAKMQQAFVKVLENAVQALKSEGRISVQTRNLELSEATQDRTAKLNAGIYICVEISDTGEGIAPDVLPRIFEPFFTTKGKNHRGLGLAWVYGIITNHGGGVAVSSQPGIGTSVRLYLPATRKIVRDAAVALDDLSGTQTVLIVDDEDLLLTMGQMVLSSYGYTVLTANSGQRALEMFSNAKQPIDLVITDLVMPNMSGRELTEHIQKISPSTKIIWSSGYVRGRDEAQEFYLQKPFTSQDLLRKVKQALTE